MKILTFIISFIFKSFTKGLNIILLISSFSNSHQHHHCENVYNNNGELFSVSKYLNRTSRQTIPNGMITVSVEDLWKISEAKSLSEVLYILGIQKNRTTFAKAEGEITTVDDLYIEDAKQALCEPEMQTVDLMLPDTESTTHYPSCVKINQCGGCCVNKDDLSCTPTKTKVITVRGIKVQYISGEKIVQKANQAEGNKLFDVKPELVNVTIEEHLECECDCRVTESHCNPTIHQYDESTCSCVCIDKKEKEDCFSKNTHYWVSKTCSCYCRGILECSSGQTFDHSDCSCKSTHGAKIGKSGLALRQACDLLKIVEEHRSIYEERTDYARYVPNKSCFICATPNCDPSGPDCSSVVHYNDFPLYHNNLEFGFYGKNFPLKIFVQISLNKYCYLKLQVMRVVKNKFTEWIYISWNECKFATNICYHILHHIENVFDFSKECLFFSIEISNKPKKVNFGVSDKCTISGSALSELQYNLPITQNVCLQDSPQFSSKANFEIHPKPVKEYDGVVLILPCSTGGYAVNKHTGRFVHGKECEVLFANKSAGGRIEDIIKTLYNGNENLLFPIKKKMEESPYEEFRPIYIGTNFLPIAASVLTTEESPNKEKGNNIRDGCNYVPSGTKTTSVPMRKLENSDRIVGIHHELNSSTRTFDEEFHDEVEKRKSEAKNNIQGKSSLATDDRTEHLEVQALREFSSGAEKDMKIFLIILILLLPCFL